MINLKMVFRILASLLFIESFFLFLSTIVAIIYSEPVYALIVPTLITFVIGAFGWFNTNKASKQIGKREGYLIVSLVWVVFSLFGSLPFIFDGSITSFTDAFFETMSGFTTTGASILNDIESLPKSILFWRSITQWMGGMGMIVMSLAVLPMLGIAGMELFIAEVPGPTADKLHPRVKETAKRLWGIYSLFTVIEIILLYAGGMDFFDSINHSFTTMATGGYSTKQASIAYYDSAYIQYVITIFMIIAGVNFSLSYFALKLKFEKVYKNEEFRYYIGFILIFTLILTTIIVSNKNFTGFEKSFRDALFQVVSLITTTGFVTADYLAWGSLAAIISFSIMFFGGSAGSTGGGIKIVRIVLLFKNSYQEFKRLLHPNAIIPVRLNNKAVDPKIITNVLAFIVFYILTFVAGSVVMASMGLEIDSAMGSVIASLGNIGPGIGSVGPMDNFANIPNAGKWVLSFLMMLGRLELFTVMIIFTPIFWKK
ncbi:MAG: TrkH family potassium uptake protein [Bacteroidales bacterium]|nr:TrkH family potassium uptake protein [Bacteroidales bacterium]MBN2758575.1 TrkH family potassium uptake protein [Bacteroidales bacterium]